MIDLHLHTTASDGSLTPAALVARAYEAGLRIISVTDHDTLAGLAEADAAGRAAGLRVVPGVEITAVREGRDVHLLGYFIDPADAALSDFLDRQRRDRLRRVREVVARLAALGAPIDFEPALAAAAAHPGRSIGRPQIADALAAAGHVRNRNEAFDRWLGTGRPAFVPRAGAPPEEVLAIVRRAGGLVSLAHPGLTAMDDAVESLAAAGLAALEVRHSDHDAATEARYRAMAARYGLAVSGGSDFHGDGGHRVPTLGSVTLPAGDFAALETAALEARQS